jgi:hypothetical protein
MSWAKSQRSIWSTDTDDNVPVVHEDDAQAHLNTGQEGLFRPDGREVCSSKLQNYNLIHHRIQMEEQHYRIEPCGILTVVLPHIRASQKIIRPIKLSPLALAVQSVRRNVLS